jgi:hypothetical protein
VIIRSTRGADADQRLLAVAESGDSSAEDGPLVHDDETGPLHVEEVLRVVDGDAISGDARAAFIASALVNQSSPIPSQIASPGAEITWFCRHFTSPGRFLTTDTCRSPAHWSRHSSRVRSARRWRTKITLSMVVLLSRFVSFWDRRAGYDRMDERTMRSPWCRPLASRRCSSHEAFIRVVERCAAPGTRMTDLARNLSIRFPATMDASAPGRTRTCNLLFRR